MGSLRDRLQREFQTCELPRSQASWAVQKVMRVCFGWGKGKEVNGVFVFFSFEELASGSGWLRGAGQIHPSTLPYSSSPFLRPWRGLTTGTGDTWWPIGLGQRQLQHLSVQLVHGCIPGPRTKVNE